MNVDVLGDGSIHGITYTPLGLVTDFKYGQELSRAFKGNNPLKWFKNFGMLFLFN